MFPLDIRRHVALFGTVGIMLLGTACAADGAGSDDGADSAVIVTTPDAATTEPAGTDPATTISPTDVPDDTDVGETPAPGSTVTPSRPPPSTDTAPTAATATVPPSTDASVGDPAVRLETVGEFDQPVDLVARPGDEHLYVVEQPGQVVRVPLAGGDAAIVADLSDRVRSGGERGLLGVEFSGDGSLAWANYTDSNGDTVIAEFPVTADGSFDTAAERVLITIDQPYGNHNAGDLELGPDAMLYIPLGDGGSGGDPERRASDPTSLLGSLLRIDPTPSTDSPYTIPPDNPYADGVDGAPEVWAWGLRNPWKIAFDPITDDLWIADVGQNAHEEVNRSPASEGGAARGANFGWSGFEGTERFNDDVDDPGDTTMPVLTYPHSSGGCSISGGVPYRGTAIPELEPAFLYSDFCTGTLWALDLAGNRNLTLAEGIGSVTAVRTGPDGEAYVLTAGGNVSRIVPA